jgi:hypothetical protein
MGSAAVCLDSNQNAVSCGDSDCTYGPCGAVTTVGSQTGATACLDQSENPVACTDPNCTYGDCITSASASLNAVGSTAAKTSAGSGSSLGSELSALTSLATVGAAAYVATTSTPVVARAPIASGFSFSNLTSGSGLILLLLLAVGAFFIFSKKSA